MRYTFKILLLLFLGFTSCKSSKKITETIKVEEVSTKKLISNHYEHVFNKQTLEARLNAKYNDKNTSATIVVKLRLEKDKTIWMSATKMSIPIAKLKITPNRVSYYEKLNKTYFDGDFSLLTKWLGTELDYEKVQNILLGQAILNLRKGKYDSKITDNMYELIPKKNEDLFDILFFLNPENFKLEKQEINNQKKKQMLQVSYPNYTNIEGEEMPQNIDITAKDIKKTTTINIEYKSVEFNKELTYPFEIPSGYKQISLK
jgi:hypothetical protein